MSEVDLRRRIAELEADLSKVTIEAGRADAYKERIAKLEEENASLTGRHRRAWADQEEAHQATLSEVRREVMETAKKWVEDTEWEPDVITEGVAQFTRIFAKYGITEES